MSASKVLVACWLGLAVLSISTVVLGNAGATLALAGGVLLAVRQGLADHRRLHGSAMHPGRGACCCSAGRWSSPSACC